MKLSTFCTEALLVSGAVRTLDSNYYLLGNKVLDGKFEIWNSASELRFWTSALSGSSVVVQNATYVHAGTYSLRLTVDASNSAVSVSQTTFLSPGWYYTLTIYVRNSAAGKTSKIQLCDTGGNTYLLTTGSWDTSGYISVPNSFQEFTAYTVTFKAPDYEIYTLTLGNDSAVSSNIYFDSLSILEAATGRPTAQYPQIAREAEIYCQDAAVRYAVGGMVPTISNGIILETSDTATSPANPKILKGIDDIRTFRAIRDSDTSGLLIVNYKR